MGASPALVDAYSLVKTGIVDPIVLPYNEFKQCTISSPAQIYKVTTNDISGKQYFLLQHRNKTGIFDMTAFTENDPNDSGGLLIYHIDMNGSYLIEGIVEAHGGLDCIDHGSGGKLGDLWGNDKNIFSEVSTPTSNLYQYRDVSSLEKPIWVPNPVSTVKTISSGVKIHKIHWDGLNKKTTFTIGAMSVSSNKQFNITYNYPIRSETINSNNIYVKDSNNNIVDTTLIMESNNKIVVIPPDDGYTPQMYYTLVVSNNIQSLGGNTLEQEQLIDFWVE